MGASVTTADRSRFLDIAALSALRHMRFVAKGQIEGAYSGRHRSRQMGGTTEFVDYREYAPGEDLRRLDWKILGRTGKPVIRLYQDETNLRCTLAIDASNSMNFGSHRGLSKLEFVQWLATGMSSIIAAQQDQVGLASIGSKLGEVFPPGSTPTHVLQVQSKIENLKTDAESNLAAGLRDLFARLSHRGVLVLFSDFLVDDLEPLFATLRLFRHRRWEVIVLHVIHPDEESLPDGLAYRFEGMENDGSIDCSPEQVRSAYRQRFDAHVSTVRLLALAAGCDYRRASSATPYTQVLSSFLVERSG